MALLFKSIFRRIAAGYGAILLLLSACGAVGGYTVHRLQQDVFQLIDTDLRALSALSNVSNGLYQEEVSMTIYRERLALGTARDDMLVAYQAAKASIERDFKTLDAYAVTNPEVRASVDDLKTSVRSREAAADSNVAIIQAGLTPSLAAEYDLAQEAEAAVDNAHAAVVQDFKADTARAEAAATRGLIAMGALLLLGVLGAALVGVQIARNISRPLTQLTGSAERIAAGERIDPPQLDRTDEVGVLSRAVARMVRSLRDLAEKERALRVDIAEHRRVQDRLQQEVGVRQEAERQLEQQAEELKRSNAELEQFAYVASHDLQEPLRMVSGYSSLLKKRYAGKLDADADEFLDFAVEGVTRMQALINDLLAYSRVGREPRASEPTDASAALARALGNLQVAVAEKQALVTYHDLPSVMANPFQLGQLFQNLIGNAIKFCRDRRPEISVTAERQGSEWMFCVRDNGIGIDPQYRERIFMIFQRLHKRNEYPGTGIGLAICKKIVERHGGRIWVESKPGEGSAFFFTFQGAAEQQKAQSSGGQRKAA